MIVSRQVSTVKSVFLSVLVIAGLCVNFLVEAAGITPDYEREQRLIDEAEAGLFDGEIVFFPAGNRDVFALLSEPEEPTIDGIVMLLHGRGFHPDWPQVVGPLREGLTDNGIPTFSVQMPVLAKDAKYYDYLEIIPESFPRIQGAIEYLKNSGYEWIAIVAHSCSVHMTMSWIQQFGYSGFHAYAGIGMGATDYRQPMLQPFPFDQISLPVLDLFGSEDYPAVVKAASERMDVIHAVGNPQSAQVIIDGADHFFDDYEDELVSAVTEWITSLHN